MSKGLVERFNISIKELLRTLLIDMYEWDTHLDKVLFALRISANNNTGYSPSHIVYEKNIKLTFDHMEKEVKNFNSQPYHIFIKNIENDLNDIIHKVQRALCDVRDKMDSYYNENACENKYTIGDNVFIKNMIRGKLDLFYQ
ncbi:hypothetical protein RF11_05863 [Thelohanellus kitauei]|uniref:Integrase catalytic domain-containing protein n=1 Tax=Thelohanellus kitauei TaxID=669202 RepID=A0A0C2M274_THEKT|nr:hypothetical protein RF11_05863 [Thelohanellus kitauei]